MTVDKVLITGELGGVVASDGLVAVGRAGLPELGHVEHAVARDGVGEDCAVGISERERVAAAEALGTYLKQHGGTLHDTAIFAVQHACEKWVAAL